MGVANRCSEVWSLCKSAVGLLSDRALEGFLFMLIVVPFSLGHSSLYQGGDE